MHFCKVVHQGMRPYFFSADTQEDMLGWVRALSQSASMETDGCLNRYAHSPGATTAATTAVTDLLSSFQALFKLSGFHKDRRQQWIRWFNKAHVCRRGSRPKAQTHQQDSEWAQSPHWWEDGDDALRAQREADWTSEKQQVVKTCVCVCVCASAAHITMLRFA